MVRVTLKPDPRRVLCLIIMYPTVLGFLPDDFLSFSRKKKHPHLAHRSHEFFDASLAPPFPTRTSQRLLDDETDSRVRERERQSEIGIWFDSAKVLAYI